MTEKKTNRQITKEINDDYDSETKIRPLATLGVGKLWVETPDGEMRCLGAAYGGYAEDNTEEAPPFWMWNGRVWMYGGYMMELVRR